MKIFTAYRRTPPPQSECYNDYTEAQYEGVVFSDGRVAVRWLTAKRSVSIWDSLADLMAVHGHEDAYNTEIHWHETAGVAEVTDSNLRPILSVKEAAGAYGSA